MSFFKKLGSLFATKGENAPLDHEWSAETYKGFTIKPMPLAEDGGFRVNGVIEKAESTHRFIRADVLMDEAQCADEMVRKAKCMIDQQGDMIFR